MSGGHFNYVCRTIPTKLDEVCGEQIPEMLHWLKENGGSPEVIKILRGFLGRATRVADEATSLVDLLRAVEWWASGDSGPDAVNSEVRGLIERGQPLERPHIITMCGSTRFTREMLREAWRLTKAGNIVIHWNILEGDAAFAHGAEKEGGNIKDIIDALYLHKVAMADEVRILNVGGYVGESTRNELAHARKLGKEISWLEPDRIPEDLR